MFGGGFYGPTPSFKLSLLGRQQRQLPPPPKSHRDSGPKPGLRKQGEGGVGPSPLQCLQGPDAAAALPLYQATLQRQTWSLQAALGSRKAKAGRRLREASLWNRKANKT